MTVGELTLRGCYLGSNVSYNVKKMVENEYLVHERSVHDRRSVHVRLTERGIKLRDRLTAMHSRHAEMLSRAALSADEASCSPHSAFSLSPVSAGKNEPDWTARG
jgi:DNA-binding MarR family transcriptional regulator